VPGMWQGGAGLGCIGDLAESIRSREAGRWAPTVYGMRTSPTNTEEEHTGSTMLAAEPPLKQAASLAQSVSSQSTRVPPSSTIPLMQSSVVNDPQQVPAAQQGRDAHSEPRFKMSLSSSQSASMSPSLSIPSPHRLPVSTGRPCLGLCATALALWGLWAGLSARNVARGGGVRERWRLGRSRRCPSTPRCHCS
jgi:hypothetical protein